MGLARALAVDPAVLLLDEPFGALDAHVRAELRVWLRRLHEETHTTTVIVTHDQEEAMDVADEVVVMNRGKVEQVAPPRELYEQPANEFVMTLRRPGAPLRETFVRPHDLEVTLEPNGTTREAMVERIVHLGFEVRVELVRDDGERFSVQMTRDQAELLELATGQIVYVKPTRQTTFSSRRRLLPGFGLGDDALDARRQPAGGEVGEGDLLEDRADVEAQRDPDVAERDGVRRVLDGLRPDAADRRQRAADGRTTSATLIVGGRPREAEPPSRPRWASTISALRSSIRMFWRNALGMSCDCAICSRVSGPPSAIASSSAARSA